MRIQTLILMGLFVAVLTTPVYAGADARLEGLKKEALAEVESRAELTQQMVDSIFSFAELGFQEFDQGRIVSWPRNGRTGHEKEGDQQNAANNRYRPQGSSLPHVARFPC